MKFGFSQSEIITTAKSLGLPTDGFVQRRVARAIDILESNKVNEIDDGIFRVHSQYDENKSYIVNVNHGAPYCDCPDGERTINCKHRIASLLYARRQAQAITIIKTTDGNDGDYWRRCWCIAQGNRRTLVYEEPDGRLFCNCGAYYQDCKHKQLVIKTVTNELKQIVNECGTEQAKQLQDKMNGQLDSQNNNGNGAQAPSQMQLDISDPFQEAESLDIDQIEGRSNGEFVHKLSNGEYVISYKGIMTLSQKHGIEFSEAIHDDTHTVIAKGRCGTSERLSGKPMNGNVSTALELVKRNAARQLLPLVEIKAVETKAQLEATFDWQVAQAKCVELVGTKANVDIIIHELTQAGKLRQDNPSHYDRTEWLIIYNACRDDASNDDEKKNDGGDNSPSSDDGWKAKLRECKDAALNETRFDWIRSDLESEGILPKHPQEWNLSEFSTLRQACELDSSLFNRALGDDFHIQKERNWGGYESSRRYRFWLVTKDTFKLREKCFVCGKTKRQVKQLGDDLIWWERYEVKISICNECESTDTETLTKKFDELYHNGNGAVDTTGLPKTAEYFIARCREAIDKVREKKNAVEANEQPLEGSNGKRKIQMDKKLRTWLVESDGTKTEISCREICEKFDDGSIITRLRAGIDSGADISTVELDD